MATKNNPNKKDNLVSDDKNQSVGKYLTEMKELPPEEEKTVSPKNASPQPKETPAPKKVEDKIEQTAEKEIEKDKENVVLPESEKTNNDEESVKLSIFTSKDIVLGIVNLVSVILLVFILFQFPKRAAELREIRKQILLDEANISFLFEDVEENKKKAEELQKLFLDESGIVGFVNEVEKIKSSGSTIQKVTFASQEATKDRAGNLGIPVVIELRGSWEAIDVDLQKIDKLPYLLRASGLEIEPSEEEPQVLIFKYGVFLYVNDELGQNR